MNSRFDKQQFDSSAKEFRLTLTTYRVRGNDEVHGAVEGRGARVFVLAIAQVYSTINPSN